MSSVKKIVALSAVAWLGCNGMAVGSLHQAHAAIAQSGYLVFTDADQEVPPDSDQGMVNEQPETGDLDLDPDQDPEITPGYEDLSPGDMDSLPLDQDQDPADQDQDAPTAL